MKKVLILIVVCFLAGCSSNSTQSKHDTTIVDYNIKQGAPLPSKDWHCYNIDEDKICAPEAWGFVKQNSFFFISDLSHVAPSSYFVVVKQDKKATGLVSCPEIACHLIHPDERKTSQKDCTHLPGSE